MSTLDGKTCFYKMRFFSTLKAPKSPTDDRGRQQAIPLNAAEMAQLWRLENCTEKTHNQLAVRSHQAAKPWG